MPVSVLQVVENTLEERVLAAEAVGGGCIAQATRLRTESRDLFLKHGEGAVTNTLAAEATGLAALASAQAPLMVPRVILCAIAEGGRPGLLLTEWVDQERPGAGFHARFGSSLAEMHRFTGPTYGFIEDNYIGRLAQQNAPLDDWIAFFRERRLMPQATMARNAGLWREHWDEWFDNLLKRLPDVLPAHPEASILHGDLWSGNYLSARGGRAALIDPAVYYGHRECDLAMTELFGGFDARFYDAYRAAWPLEPGYEARRELYNLYHLINHLNYFGEGYTGSVERILRAFGS